MFEQYPLDSFGYPLDGLEFQSFSGSGDSCYSSYNECFNSRSTQNCFPVESPESVAPARAAKQLKTSSNTWTASCTTATDPILPPKPSSASSNSQIISFENSNNSSSVANSHHFYSLDPTTTTTTLKPKTENLSNHDNLDFTAFISQATYDYNQQVVLKHDKGAIANKAATITRNPIQAQDHVMAERKRREKLSQRFIALSAILPGLKKVLTHLLLTTLGSRL